nr:MAG TPA: hypothetical protein [Caudoviricetes sp.]
MTETRQVGENLLAGFFAIILVRGDSNVDVL